MRTLRTAEEIVTRQINTARQSILQAHNFQRKTAEHFPNKATLSCQQIKVAEEMNRAKRKP